MSGKILQFSTKGKIMKILFFADLHHFDYDNLEKIKNLNYDICITLGDINKQILLALRREVSKDIYGVLGNHDTFGLFDGTGIIDLAFKNTKIQDIMFCGIDGGSRYKRGNYVMYKQEELLEKTKDLSECDILISHETGFHYLKDDVVHEGFVAIDDYIKKFKPKYSIFGHYHQNLEFEKFDTKFICIYQCAIFDTDSGSVEYIF